MTATGEDPDGPISVDVEIVDGRTTITVSGDHDASVIVRSASGERVYLPPERTPDADDADPYRPAGTSESPYDGVSDDGSDTDPNDSPYEGVPSDSPYEGVPDDSPYDSAQQSSMAFERTSTANGFRIVHPEPVTDFRFLR